MQVVSPDAKPLKHVRDPRVGTAVCGEPTKIENLVDWGEDVTCQVCQEAYAARARRAGS